MPAPEPAGLASLEIAVPPTPEGKLQAMEAVEFFGQGHGWADPIRNEVSLILEEWLSNILKYSGAAPESRIDVQVRTGAERMEVRVRDAGEPFNPLTQAEPDLSKPLEERPIGGLGIHMIKRLTDQMSWERVEGLNSLTFLKSCRSPKLAPR